MVILGKPHSAWVAEGEAFSSFGDTLSCRQLAVRGTCCQPPSLSLAARSRGRREATLPLSFMLL